jgi:hypothetical protein
MTIQAYTSAELNILPPPVTTGTTIQSFIDLYNELWVAKNGVYGGAWKKARDVLRASVYRVAAIPAVPTTNTVFPADTVLHDAYGLWTGSPTYVFTTPAPLAPATNMWWRFAFHWTLAGATSPNYVGCQIWQNGAAITQDNMIMNTTGGCTARTQFMGLASTSTDTWQAEYVSSVASLAASTGQVNNAFSIAFMGLFFG